MTKAVTEEFPESSYLVIITWFDFFVLFFIAGAREVPCPLLK